MRSEAAQCELEGPRITGPMTSLKMLGYVVTCRDGWGGGERVYRAMILYASFAAKAPARIHYGHGRSAEHDA
jgi:hypothetical protein